MQVLIVAVGVLLFLAVLVMNDMVFHGRVYRRVRNRASVGRGEPEPYPNGHLRPEVRTARLASLRARRTRVMALCVALVVMGVVIECTHPDTAMRIRGVGSIVIGITGFVVVNAQTRVSS